MARKVKKVRRSSGYKLPRELTTVTPLSKALAIVCFVTIPVIAFFLGVRLQEANQPSSYDISPMRYQMMKQGSITPTPSPKKTRGATMYK